MRQCPALVFIMTMEYLPLGINTDPLFLPKDLVGLVNSGENVARFKDTNYPERVLIDDVREHTIRCVRIARKINIGDLDKERLERILWIHDLSEIIASDTSILIKKDMTEDQLKELKDRENESARLLLTKEDMDLYEDFENVNDFINERSGDTIFSSEALIAFVIDKIEGNLFFHYHISKWANSPEYDEGFSGMNKYALVYTYLQYETFVKQINTLEGRYIDARDVCLDILSAQMGQVRGWWSEAGGMPNGIRKVIYDYS